MAIPKLIQGEDVLYVQSSPSSYTAVVVENPKGTPDGGVKYDPDSKQTFTPTQVADWVNYPYGASQAIPSDLEYPVIDQASGEIRPGTCVLPSMPTFDWTTHKLETIESRPRESASQDKPFTEAYEGVDYVPFNPANYSYGSVIVASGDYPAYAPGPVIEAVIGGTKAIFIGRKACEDAKELVINQKMGTFYADGLFYMLSPTTVYTGDYNCVPCDPWCCIAYCYIKDPEEPVPVRKHRVYYRVYAFTTFVYDLQDEGRKYESINSNVVVVRTVTLPITFDVIYIPAGVTHIRYWSKNEEVICTPDDSPPCPFYCGKEIKIGGDDEFFLRDEVEIPKEFRKKVGEL